ncbi:3-keto steroid reductase-like protein [Pleurostoma richardsiae]|uniref:3-keto steroid reductase-like protein n=1 Tax=Pleurostoma richardsiae TaxID=41990 RepID=A0AA38RN89_9PEZI|nr:3-keto steroid reductase-like protein [Pleurostoma richardsiae]
MPAAPWDSVPPKDTLFVLITGANSGIGLGIAERLIDEFLASRSLSSHLVLIATTRSTTKSAETINSLRRHLKKAAYTSKALQSRAGPSYKPSDALRRVHILSVQIDLCDLPTIYKAADELINGTISNPAEGGEFESLTDVKIPRLDAIIFNAGMGGWTGLDWLKLAMNFLTSGWVQATTFPTFKAGANGDVVRPISSKYLTGRAKESDVPEMGRVFCANVFGHYLFAHALLPLLSRPASSDLPPGRIIWESSIEPVWDNLSLDDFQAVRTTAAYESTKRLTDVLTLTADLPSVRSISAPYFDITPTPGSADEKQQQEQQQAASKPRLYLTHPGIVVTTLFPLSVVLFYLYKAAMYVSRWLGSPWHTVTAYKGAAAPAWLALAGREELDARRAERVKWGSACSRAGADGVKETEVDGWGWEGRVEDRGALARDAAAGILRRMVGRRAGAMDLTEEKRAEFEALGAKCWEEMERLRAEWEARLADLKKGEQKGSNGVLHKQQQ